MKKLLLLSLFFAFVTIGCEKNAELEEIPLTEDSPIESRNLCADLTIRSVWIPSTAKIGTTYR